MSLRNMHRNVVSEGATGKISQWELRSDNTEMDRMGTQTSKNF